jgi:hypothetical protein
MGDILPMHGGHIKTTLPPSFSYAQVAGVFYYVKCTVSVPSLFRENPRVATFFHFCPIEPPRPPEDGECYARRQHTFLEDMQEKKKKSLGNVFRKESPSNLPSPTAAPVRITLDARLPNPAILTCGSPVPLRLLLTPQTTRKAPIFLQTLQVEVIGITKIRSSQLTQSRSTSWVITSVSNLNTELGEVGDLANTTSEISKSYWENYRLPDSICPSFRTCNIERSYEVVATLGLTYGTTSPGMDQFVSLRLRHKIEIYSGIAPPPELLNRTQRRPTGPIGPSVPLRRPVPPVQQGSAFHNAPPTPTAADMNAPLQDEYGDAPPSYEDAIADNLPALEAGPRNGYRPPEPSMANVWDEGSRKS